MWLAIRKVCITLGVGMSLTKAMKAAKYAAAEEERKFLAEEASGEGEKSDEGASAENLE